VEWTATFAAATASGDVGGDTTPIELRGADAWLVAHHGWLSRELTHPTPNPTECVGPAGVASTREWMATFALQRSPLGRRAATSAATRRRSSSASSLLRNGRFRTRGRERHHSGIASAAAAAGRPEPPRRIVVRLRPARLRALAAKCWSRPRRRPLLTGDTPRRGGPPCPYHGGEEEDSRTRATRSSLSAAGIDQMLLHAPRVRAQTSQLPPHPVTAEHDRTAFSNNLPTCHQTPRQLYIWAKRHEVRCGLSGGPAGPTPLLQTQRGEQ
jgi:hypothetical protein